VAPERSVFTGVLVGAGAIVNASNPPSNTKKGKLYAMKSMIAQQVSLQTVWK
jgi:hypothetical protein